MADPGGGATEELEWQFLQCFGQPTENEEIQEADLLSALEFDPSGEFLATGDRGGRVVLLQQVVHNKRRQEETSPDVRPSPWILPYEYQYLTEFQSHQPEFDYLKSVDIDERINVIAWVRSSNQSRLILSANDKTVKLWKVFEKKVTELTDFNLPQSQMTGVSMSPPPLTVIDHVSQLRVPRAVSTTNAITAHCKKTYASVHAYFINSISVNSDQEVFLSSDDLRIHLWHLDHTEKSFVVVDVKPSSMQDLVEVITDASFHPTDCNTLVYASSRGCIYMSDMRDQALCEGKATVFEDTSVQSSKSFFSEVIASVSDVRFSCCGRYMLSRDYMHARLWDIRMNRTPLRRFQAHEHLWSKLCDLYENEAIFDKFGCAMSGNGQYVATGSYNNQFRVYNAMSDSFSTLHANRDPLANTPDVNQAAEQEGLAGTQLSWKLLHLAWHPQHHTIAAAALNSLYIYCARTL